MGINNGIALIPSLVARLPIIPTLKVLTLNKLSGNIGLLSVVDLRQYHTSSGNSLVSVNQQLAIGFGIAFGLIVLKIFQGDVKLINNEIHNAFRYTFLVVGSLTILSGFVFRRLHFKDGENMT